MLLALAELTRRPKALEPQTGADFERINPDDEGHRFVGPKSGVDFLENAVRHLATSLAAAGRS